MVTISLGTTSGGGEKGEQQVRSLIPEGTNFEKEGNKPLWSEEGGRREKPVSLPVVLEKRGEEKAPEGREANPEQ